MMSEKRSHKRRCTDNQGTRNSTSTGGSRDTSVAHCSSSGNAGEGESQEHEVVELCGRHLDSFNHFLKKRKRGSIRIRTDIFEVEEPDEETLHLWTQLETVRVDSMTLFADAIARIQPTSNAKDADELKKQLDKTMAVVDSLKERLLNLSQRVAQAGLTLVELHPKRTLDFETAGEYMEELVNCIELEPQIEAEWKTTLGLIKHRIGRILQYCTNWGTSTFPLNYCRSVDAERLKVYTDAIDFVNTITTAQHTHAVIDDEYFGVKEFRHQLAVLKTKATTAAPSIVTSEPESVLQTETRTPTSNVLTVPGPEVQLRIVSVSSGGVATLIKEPTTVPAITTQSTTALAPSSTLSSMSQARVPARPPAADQTNHSVPDGIRYSTQPQPSIILKKYKSKEPVQVIAGTSASVDLNSNFLNCQTPVHSTQAISGHGYHQTQQQAMTIRQPFTTQSVPNNMQNTSLCGLEQPGNSRNPSHGQIQRSLSHGENASQFPVLGYAQSQQHAMTIHPPVTSQSATTIMQHMNLRGQEVPGNSGSMVPVQVQRSLSHGEPSTSAAALAMQQGRHADSRFALGAQSSGQRQYAIRSQPPHYPSSYYYQPHWPAPR